MQLVADEYGNAVALNGRDCSLECTQKNYQRRPACLLQVLIPDVWAQPEKIAISLLKAIEYANVGTSEYLYNEIEQKFYF